MFTHKKLFFIAGLVWLAIGTSLLTLGIHFIMETLRNPVVHLSQPGKFSLLLFLDSLFSHNRQNTVVVILSTAILAGYMKGKFVLGKSVERHKKRIASLPNPTSIRYLYTKGYLLLIASMMGLGFLMKVLPITIDTRGAVDVTIGSALVNGATLYFRSLKGFSKAT
ncbi:MAG: hypothetical protein K940chlam9_01889 [Chlamydiae bacterium]|nr:hypothetical protein [Chlamydiota bacterium]